MELLLKDDVTIQQGDDSGGITDIELLAVMDRSDTGVAALPTKGKGYEVVTEKVGCLIGKVGNSRQPVAPRLASQTAPEAAPPAEQQQPPPPPPPPRQQQ